MVGWAVLTALVRTVIIEMSGELVKHGHGVTFVVDQHPVGTLRSDTAHEPLRVTVRSGVRGGDFTGSMPSEANTASNDAANFVSRSRIRNRNREIPSPRFISRLRAACVVHAAVGYAVTPRMCTRRVRTSITNRIRRAGAGQQCPDGRNPWPAGPPLGRVGRCANRCPCAEGRDRCGRP